MSAWRIGAGAGVVALCAVAAAVGLLTWYFVAPASPTCSRARSSKALRREQQREVRRRQKDQQLLRKKHERATEREQQEQVMSDEQKRERMERIKMQRVEQYQKLDDGMLNGQRVVVDLAFAQDQTERECNSIFKQLGCVYGYLKKCTLDRTISLRVASYSEIVAERGLRHGLRQWKIHIHEASITSVYHQQEIVYLSPDAEEVLYELDPRAVYVVGGIVDRSVRKGQSISKAHGHRIRAMRLPLQEYMDVRKPVLNIDAVLIALNEVANHQDWARAFDVAIPKRMASRRSSEV